MSTLSLALQLLAAAAAGTAVGLERQFRNHPAGIRTHALVAIGAATFTIVGTSGFDADGVSGDPSRIAAQVASGIGFIGAGAILKEGVTVRGLTTATSIWVSGAMGVAAGAGYYQLLVATVVVALVVLLLVGILNGPLERAFRPIVVVELEYRRGHGTLGPVLSAIDRLHGSTTSIAVEDTPDQRLLHLTIRRLHREGLVELLEQIRAIPEIVHATARYPTED